MVGKKSYKKHKGGTTEAAAAQAGEVSIFGAMKAQAANERKNAGIQMMGGALSNLAMGSMMGAGAATGVESGLSNRLVNNKIAQGNVTQGLLSNFMSNKPEINQAYAPFSMQKPNFSAYQLPKYTPQIY